VEAATQQTAQIHQQAMATMEIPTAQAPIPSTAPFELTNIKAEYCHHPRLPVIWLGNFNADFGNDSCK